MCILVFKIKVVQTRSDRNSGTESQENMSFLSYVSIPILINEFAQC